MPRKNSVGDGGSAAQKRALGALPDAVRATKKSSKQVASGTTAEKGAAKVRWEGYDKKDDTWEPITHLQGYATMVKAFKESHAKDVEKLAADRVREAEKKAKDNAASTPKHTVLSMAGLTSAVWTLGMFDHQI